MCCAAEPDAGRIDFEMFCIDCLTLCMIDWQACRNITALGWKKSREDVATSWYRICRACSMEPARRIDWGGRFWFRPWKMDWRNLGPVKKDNCRWLQRWESLLCVVVCAWIPYLPPMSGTKPEVLFATSHTALSWRPALGTTSCHN